MVLSQMPPVYFYGLASLFGLVIGSFLNVVIARLPRMLDAEWQSAVAATLGRDTPQPETSFNLATPVSMCPHCGISIRPWQNIPVVGFVLLRGRCAGCSSRISLQYPGVELLSAGLSVLVAWHFGPTLACVLALVMTWALVCLAVIDGQTYLLPDRIVLPLLWLGLLANANDVFVTPVDSIFGAAAGYLFLWGIYHLFRLATGKEGLGFGDFKLMAALGAWLGWQHLPLVLLIGSVLALVLALVMRSTGRLAHNQPIPFGPFLAAGGWITMVAGDPLLTLYLSVHPI